MGIIAAWNALLGVDNTNWKKGFKEAGEATDEAKSKYEKFLRSVRQGFGKRSAAGETIELLKGAGVAGAVGLAAKEFKEFAEKTAELVNQAREGNLGFREMSAQVLRTIPVLGEMVQGFDALRDAILGESAALQRQIEDAKELNSEYEKLRQVTLLIKEYDDDLVDAQRQLGINMASGLQKQFLEAAERFRVSAKVDLAKLMADFKKAGFEDFTFEGLVALPGEIKKAKEELGDLQQQQKKWQDYLRENPTSRDAPLEVDSINRAITQKKAELDDLNGRNQVYQEFGAKEAVKKAQEINSDVKAVWGTMTQQWDKTADKWRDAIKESFEKSSKKIEEGDELQKSVEKAGERFERQITEWKHLLNDHTIDAQTFQRLAQKAYGEEAAQLRKRAVDLREDLRAEVIQPGESKYVSKADLSPLHDVSGGIEENTKDAVQELKDLNKTVTGISGVKINVVSM